MKKTTLSSLILLFVALTGICTSASANVGAAAGDLTYEHVSDSTYRVILRLFTDCSYSAPPNSVTLCTYNTCTNATFALTMNKYGNSTKVGPGCPQYKTTCDSPASALPGYMETYYATVVTLPLRCASWKFSARVDYRNNITNLMNPTAGNIYFETFFDNTVSLNNSSPVFITPALVYTGLNQSYTYNIGAVDPDGDSLRIQLLQPLTGSANCANAPVKAAYAVATPPYTITNNPIQTNNTFALNSSNGQYAFTPTTQGFSNMAVRVSEYRNGSLIGSVMRELQVTTLPISGNPVHGYNVYFGCGQTGTNLTKVDACPGQNLSFCFDLKGSGGVFKLLDDISISIPGATLTYTNQGTDSVHAVFNWTPGINDVGYHEIKFLVSDSSCAPPGIVWRSLYRLGINVWGKTKTINDTIMCPNGSIQLSASGGNTYTWSILPGGSTGSLSNPNIPNPVATPSVTTTYVVTSTGNSICPNLNKDTVTITVLPPSSVSYASVKIFVAPDSNINAGDTVTFNAAQTNCSNPFYQWMLNGNAISGATQTIYKTSMLTDQDRIWCVLTCKDTCPSPQDTFSNVITMHVGGNVQDFGTMKNIHLYPNPNNGIFTIVLNDDRKKAGQSKIEIRNVYGQLVFSKITAENREQLKLDSLPAGLYILTVRAENDLGTASFMIHK
ncbi:MAG: T9SS type A sorting domain-containing protein [Chitinophagaceae bacterium]|nr:T9SS type A sorting domain-containing protein [Chitinophagaceae bacterium]